MSIWNLPVDVGDVDPDSVQGRLIQVNHWGSYAHAATELGGMQRSGALRLKIRSGEHLAAIALAAQLYPELPSASDTDGGVDLLFTAPAHAAEVKSLRSGWRHYESSGALGSVYQARFETWADAFSELEAAARDAQNQLSQKVNHDLVETHAVVVGFALDVLTVELFEQALVPEFPGLPEIDVDYVWVIIFPGTIQRWETAEGRWTTLLAMGREDDEFTEEVDFHELERLFLDAAALPFSASPFYDVVESLIDPP